MNPRSRYAFTLIELLISLTLIAMIVVGLGNMELFCRFHFLTADRRAKVVNEVSLAMEHITKTLNKGIGDIGQPAIVINPVALATYEASVAAWVDSQPGPAGTVGNGIRDDGDLLAGYGFEDTDHTLYFFPDIVGSPAQRETLARGVVNFTVAKLAENTLQVEVQGCWDPTITDPNRQCNTLDNPQVTMRTNVYMPAVSLN